MHGKIIPHTRALIRSADYKTFGYKFNLNLVSIKGTYPRPIPI